MMTKGLEQVNREKLIQICADANNIELAFQILEGFEHLTTEQRKEIACTGVLKYSMQKWPIFKSLALSSKSLTEFVVDWSLTGRYINFVENATLFQIADAIETIKDLGYQGRKILKRNKKTYCQFFCGKSKPSLEIELKTTI